MSKISAFHQFWHDIQLDIFFVKDTLIYKYLLKLQYKMLQSRGIIGV
jgi:hypothetical protein